MKIGKYLIDANMTQRRIGTIELWEMEGIAEAAMTEYTNCRAERYDAEESKEGVSEEGDKFLTRYLNG